ncbi:RloB family protein [Empedobacter brevis]
MAQDFRKTILIVCEGQRSEPDYFEKLRDEVLEKVKDVYIRILPIPKGEQDKIEKELFDFKVRRGGKKRIIKTALNDIEPEEYIVEEQYKSQPVCYVRKAQLGFLEKGYSELWAVYDKDGHPAHEDAYNLAIDSSFGNIVNIGFSSISFEEWILMHFEFCETPFLKSQCRDSDKNVFDCGTHTHKNDCNGLKCVVGKIVEQGYLTYNDSKNFSFNEFENKRNIAFKNALLSREKAFDKTKLYHNNPIVSIDRLVFKLTHIDKGDFNWEYNSNFEIAKDVTINILNNDNKFTVEIQNNSGSMFIVYKDLFKLIDIDFQTLWTNDRMHLEPNTSNIIFSKQNLEIEDFSYAVLKLSEQEFKILDIVQLKNFT